MKPVFDNDGLATTAGTVRVYYYDSVTREYTGWSDEYINIGVSIPGCSTDVDPGDEISGEVALFTGGEWEQREDHRGETVYSTADGAPSTVDYIGHINDGYTQLPPSSQHDKWNGAAWVTDTDAQHAADTASNDAKKTALIYEATQFIAPLVDAKDGGYIDDADVTVLTAWQKYRYMLTKVDTAKPVWPDKPE